MQFRWTPGVQMDAAAIERMKVSFARPAEHPPEAWFMGAEQGYFSRLYESLTSNPADISYLQNYLHDTGGGIKNFGRFEIWVDWFHFSLPYLLELELKDDLLPLTFSYFFNLYTDGLDEEYDGFREDVFNTLLRCTMAAHLWKGEDVDSEHWWFDSWSGYWSQAFSLSMFFCLKYLSLEQIPDWFASLMSIRGEVWQGWLVWWLRGLKRLIYLTTHIDELPIPKNDLEARGDLTQRCLEATGIGWHGSYLSFGTLYGYKSFDEFISPVRQTSLWKEVEKYPQLMARVNE